MTVVWIFEEKNYSSKSFVQKVSLNKKFKNFNSQFLATFMQKVATESNLVFPSLSQSIIIFPFIELSSMQFLLYLLLQLKHFIPLAQLIDTEITRKIINEFVITSITFKSLFGTENIFFDRLSIKRKKLISYHFFLFFSSEFFWRPYTCGWVTKCVLSQMSDLLAKVGVKMKIKRNIIS